MGRLNFILCLCSVAFCNTNALKAVPQAFPSRWDGDRYFKSQCEVIQKPPKWFDGYFFCQLFASYGDADAQDGQRVDHMFDAIGGLVSFDFSPENTTFTGSYYPTRSYKIWNFYDRDFTKSSIAWKPAYAKVNLSAYEMWVHKIQAEWDYPPPNIDFWRIKDDIIAGTEFYEVGYTFNVDTVDQFRFYPFKEATPTMLGQPFIPVHMPIHERADPDTGLIWATVSAVDITKRPPTLHQVVVSVSQEGVRTVEGVFDYSPWDPSKCQKDGLYQYDAKKDFLPRNMHSFSSTTNYLMFPLTSTVFNPCVVLQDPNPVDVTFAKFYRFDEDTKLSFLIFDKRSKKFFPSLLPFESKEPQSISHQFNGYEISDTVLVADMISYEGEPHEALDRTVLITDPSRLPYSHAYRYTLDLEKKTVTATSLTPDNPTDIEFPQFNHNFEGKRYKYGYASRNTFFAGNSILKIDMDDPSGAKNKVFKPKNTEDIALVEPFFVQKPGTTGEDDGVVVVRAYDTSVDKARVYVIDAKTMKQVGEILAPIDVPFGGHEKFYLRDSFRNKKTATKAVHSEL